MGLGFTDMFGHENCFSKSKKERILSHSMWASPITKQMTKQARNHCKIEREYIVPNIKRKMIISGLKTHAHLYTISSIYHLPVTNHQLFKLIIILMIKVNNHVSKSFFTHYPLLKISQFTSISNIGYTKTANQKEKVKFVNKVNSRNSHKINNKDFLFSLRLQLFY